MYGNMLNEPNFPQPDDTNRKEYNMNNDTHLNEEDEFTTDGFYLSYKVGDRVNTMALPADSDISEVGLALWDFIAGCGYSENLIKQIMVEQ